MAARQAQVGERLVALREDLGLSQEEAVAKTDGAITLRQWQRWEKGESEPYKRNLAALSEIFEIPISDFFGGPADPQTQLDVIEKKLDRLLEILYQRELEAEREQGRQRGHESEADDGASGATGPA